MRIDLLLAACACAAVILSACAADPAQAPTKASASVPAPVADARADSQQLHALVDEYFEQQLELNPLLATSIGDPRYNDRFLGDGPLPLDVLEAKLGRWIDDRDQAAGAGT